MEIRFAENKDTAGILALLKQVGALHHSIRPDLFREKACKYGPSQLFSLMESSDTPVFVAVEGEKVLGYCFCQIHITEKDPVLCDRECLYIDDLCVLDAYQGKGIGTKLLNCLEKFLELQGYRKVYAIITAENTVSLDFHRKNGYLCTATFPNCGYKFGRWLGVTWMEKELPFVPFSGFFPVPFPVLMQTDEKILHNLDTFSLP